MPGVPLKRLTLPLLIFSLLPLWANATETRDAHALALAHQIQLAMGGANAWDQVHFVRFDFKVSKGTQVLANRSHLWDKFAGRYRLEFTAKDGKRHVTLFNVNDRKGTAYVDGAALTGPEADKALSDAYGAFINDMYWLAMPWKWLEPGVNLRYLGKRPWADAAEDVVELSFGKVGLTPGDHYRAFISPSSHLMNHWEYVLQSGDKGAWDWTYTESAGVKLGQNHTNLQGMSINMGTVKVLSAVDDRFFTDPKTLVSLP